MSRGPLALPGAGATTPGQREHTDMGTTLPLVEVATRLGVSEKRHTARYGQAHIPVRTRCQGQAATNGWCLLRLSNSC
jgi:hypothetical protein